MAEEQKIFLEQALKQKPRIQYLSEVVNEYKDKFSQLPDNAWTIFPVIRYLIHEDYDFVFFVEPVTNFPDLFLYELENKWLPKWDPESPNVYGNMIEDRELTIIHHFAGHGEGNFYKRQFIDFSKSFVVSKRMLEIASEYLREYPIIKDSAGFNIDAQHELCEIFDAAIDRKKGYEKFSKRKWLKHVPEFNKMITVNFKSYPCDYSNKQTISQIDSKSLVAVKTVSSFHKDRLISVKNTWGKAFKHIRFFSNITTEFHGMKIENTFGIENTKTGHCSKSHAIITNFDDSKYDWLLLLDDDTIIGRNEVFQLLKCYDPNQAFLIGERYGYALGRSYGYNYITGGGGMIFSKAAIKLYKWKMCSCASADSPDDMQISQCLEQAGAKIVHEPAFHQARPNDYTEEYLEAHSAISFHKHWMIKPEKVHDEWFSPVDRLHDEL